MDLGIDGLEWTRTMGAGGFATVHAAWDEAHGRQVAVKILHAHADAATRRRFDRERRTMGSLSAHPNIVSIFTSGYTRDERPYLVMELIEGGSLAERVAAGPMTWTEAEPIAHRLLDAVDAGHLVGVVHRDIKPANILLTSDGRPLLTDFGIAVVASDATQQQTLSATPAFAAPEILQGREFDERSDLYSLAATIFALLQGRQPYGQSTDGVLTVLAQIAEAPVPVLRRSDVPEQVSDALASAMAKRPEDRPADAAALRALLLGVPAAAPATVAGEEPPLPISTLIDTPGGVTDPDGSRAGLPLSVGVALLAAAVGLAGLAWFLSGDGEGDAVVPDLAGETIVDARLALVAEGFEVPRAPSCDGALVTATDPVAGTEVADGATVSLVFDACVAPDFVDLRLQEAIDIATSTDGISISWPNYCDDLVLGQTPAAGETIDYDEPIVLELQPCADSDG